MGDPGAPDRSPASGVAQGDSFKTAKARAVAQFERTYIVSLLVRTAGNITLAARLSGKDRRDIGKLLRKYGLRRNQFTGLFSV